MDPADTVDVGGHVFSVVSEQTDPSVLTQIGVTVGGEYIPAYPEEKEFSDMPPISAASLLPLDEESLTLDMTGYMAEELKEVEVTTVLAAKTTLDEGDLVVWAKESNGDDFAIMDRTGTLDLSPSSRSTSYVYFDLIVGNADQLDMENNTLYNVTVKVSPEYDLLTGSAYTADGQQIPLTDGYYSPNGMTISGHKVSYLDMEADADSNVWDGMSETRVKLEKSPEFSELSVELYTGLYYTQEELDAAIAAGTAPERDGRDFRHRSGLSGQLFGGEWLRIHRPLAARRHGCGPAASVCVDVHFRRQLELFRPER